MTEPSTYAMVKDFISTVGFPIAVAAWLLIRGDKLMRDAIAAVRDLSVAVREGNSVVKR